MHKAWCFTSYDDEKELLQRLEDGVKRATITAFIFQREMCPTTGREHNQGYVEFTKRKRMQTAQKTCGKQAHMEGRRGTRLAAWEYCKKPESRIRGPWQFLPEGFDLAAGNQGTRSDIEELLKRIKEDVTALRGDWRDNAWALHPCTMFRGFRAAEAYATSLQEKKQYKPFTIVLWGCPGSGKSYDASTKYSTGDIYYLARPRTADGAVWWDGYQGQDTVIINDFYGWMQWTTLLCILDETPTRIEFKGGMMQFCSKRIVFTSNQSPDRWYKYNDFMLYDALLRRINMIVHYSMRRVQYVVETIYKDATP